MKKKTVALVLSAVMAAACFAGCGQESASSSGGTENSGSNSVGSSETADGSSSTGASSGSETTGKAAEDITVAGVVFQEDQFMKMDDQE